MTERTSVGILHPGNMGVFVAACFKENNHAVYWASEGRSAQSQRRAAEHGLQDAATLQRLCAASDVIISVCPPGAAEDVAQQVLAHDYEGLYLDANAISPQRAARIAQMMAEKGVTFVDGAIVGGPSWESGETSLYLSGTQVDDIASLLESGPLVTCIAGDEIGQASALKMCYAAYTKGTTALLAAILAAAEELGVRDALREQWVADWPGFAEQTEQRVRNVTAKAWRFEGEMAEIAATLRSAGVPDGFHLAAEELYRRLAHFKDDAQTPALQDVLRAVAQRSDA